MTMSSVVLVESNTSGTGRLFAQRIKSRGLAPVLLSDRPERYAYVAEDGLETQIIDTSSVGAVVSACRRTRGLVGVTTSSDYFVGVAARVARELGLPGPDPTAVSCCRDKETQYARLRAAGVSVPDGVTASSIEEAARAARDFGFPVVLKPVMGSGSIGVVLCASDAMVEKVAAGLLARSRNERGQPMPSRLLVQRYVEGEEFSAEVLAGTIVGITKKYLGVHPSFVEVGHDFPAELGRERALRIEGVARGALHALGLDGATAHVELRDDGHNCTLIEVNARLAGGFIPELVRLATGVDAVDAVVDSALGLASRLSPQRASKAGVRFLLAPSAGWLHAVHGLDAAAAVEGVVDARLYGVTAGPLVVHGDFRDRLGHVMACGEAWPEVHASLARALGEVRFELDAVKGISIST